MKRAVFGGSFDPPHKGHLQIARFVISSGIADNVIFVPAFSAPHKARKAFAPFADRLEMLRLASWNKADFIVSDIERRLNKKPSYTYDMMNAVKEEYPDGELLLLIGSDSLLELHLWRRAKDLVKKWQVVTYMRPDFDVAADELRKNWSNELAAKLAKGIISNCCLSVLASSQIRYNISMSGNCEGLDETVAAYIINKGLYLLREKEK